MRWTHERKDQAILVLQVLAMLLLLVPALALGALWVRRAWRTADAYTCVVLGAVVGLSVHIVALNALCYLFLPKHAAPILAIDEALLCLLFWFLDRRLSKFNLQQSAADIKAAWPWLLPVALAWLWHGLRQGSSDQSFHAALSTVLAHSGLPNFHPYDSAQPLLYHYGLNLCAASLGSFVGLPAWWALNFLVAFLAPLALAACVEFLRAAAEREGRSVTKAELIFGTLLFALGGNLTWVDALIGRADWLSPGRFDFACDGIAGLFPQPAAISAWTWLFGILALAMRWPSTATTPSFDVAQDKPSQGGENTASLPQGGERLGSPAIPMGLALAAVCLLAEHAALAVAAALCVFTGLHLFGRGAKEGSRNAARDLLLAGALGLGLALVQGGILTGMALNLSGTNTLRPALTGEWLPSFPTQEGRVAWGDGRYGTVLWREYAHTLLLLPVLVAWILWRGSPLAVRWLVGATLPGIAVALYMRFPLNDFDTYRFYQLYFSAAMLATGIWLAERWAPRGQPSTGKKEAGANRFSLSGKRVRVLLIACVLGLQGVRATLTKAILIYPQLPFRYDPGQVAALEEVDARGKVHEGILCQIPGLNQSVPPTPGVLGVPVAASDPDTDTQAVRGRAWQRALDCASPANLRTARTRWVCMQGEELARAILFLEGVAEFEYCGGFGDAPRYRLYRYGGEWIEQWRRPLWRIRSADRFNIRIAQLAGKSLSERELASLGDGIPETVVELSAAALAGNQGLMLDLLSTTARQGPEISCAWVLALKHRKNFWNWGALQVEALVDQAEPSEQGKTLNLKWVGFREEDLQFLFDSRIPHAMGIAFPPLKAMALRLRIAKMPEDPEEMLDWGEIYIGRIKE